MNSQQHQQYPFAYGPVQPVEFSFAQAQAQQNMQHMPPQCGNITCMYPPMQQPVAPVPQQYNPYLMQCGYILRPPFGVHGHHPMHHYPQPPPPSFFNQAHYQQPPPGMMQPPPPSPLGPHQMVPQQNQQQITPMLGQANQMNCHAQQQSIYQAQATFEVMPPPPPNVNFLPNPMDGSSCSTSSASAYPADDERRKHVFLRGALYNTEFLKPDESPQFMDGQFMDGQFMDGQFMDGQFMDGKSQSDETDEDPYDPMDEALPSIYGIRFYNPNFGPEGAIPKKTYVRKKADNSKSNEMPYAKPPESFSHSLPQFRGIYPLLPLHRMTNADSYSYQASGVAQDAPATSADNSASELDDGNMSPKCQGSMSPNSKAKQQRRQGRNRLRGFTQSFGIVAPVKRSNQSAKENMDAAKNVLSLFDTKPLNKKWLKDEWDTADPTIPGDQTDSDCNAMPHDVRILQRDLPN